MSKKKSLEEQLVWLSLIPSVPLLGILLIVMESFGQSRYLITLTGFVFLLLISYSAYSIHQNVNFQLKVVSNLLDALRNKDYSMRARLVGRELEESAFNEVARSLNDFADTLDSQKTRLRENQTLLDCVINHIDVAILLVDNNSNVELMNPAAKQLYRFSEGNDLRQQAVKLLCLIDQGKEVVETAVGAGRGRFRIHCDNIYVSGQSHKLIFVSDVSTILSAEARSAWKNLVRVLSHEVNNSLTPISTIAQSLLKHAQQKPDNLDLERYTRGLHTISERSSNLASFLSAYETLVQMPPPVIQPVYISALLEKISSLFDGEVKYPEHRQYLLPIDAVQIEQVLINLIKNAFEAMGDSLSIVSIGWTVSGDIFRLTVSDEGPGLSDTENLFVPFFTTKKGGSGIGLALSQQIVEAHGGRLSISNRVDSVGCQAALELPVRQL